MAGRLFWLKTFRCAHESSVRREVGPDRKKRLRNPPPRRRSLCRQEDEVTGREDNGNPNITMLCSLTKVEGESLTETQVSWSTCK